MQYTAYPEGGDLSGNGQVASPLVTFHPSYRRTWMFPRNIRRIEPWRIAQYLSLLQEGTSNKSWAGNQELQNWFTKALESKGLKREGVQYDSHSGGARTYIAQLKTLGLVFARDKGGLFFTKAGDDIVSGKKPPLEILQRMLFRHQYPSIYGDIRNVSIDPRIKVKPFLFVLHLFNHFKYLTQDEMVIPVVYGHNHDCLELCKTKINNIRYGAPLATQIDDPKDLYTPRTPTRSFESALVDVRDIANTLKNYLLAVCLIEKLPDLAQVSFGIAPEFQARVNEALGDRVPFIALGGSEESFQRQLGCWDRVKDTRALDADRAKVTGQTSFIRSKFFAYMGANAITEYPVTFLQIMKREFGVPENVAAEAIEPYWAKGLSYFESTYLDLSKSGGGQGALEFEKVTGALFQDKLEFKVTRTGQRSRPDRGGNYADLFLVALDAKHCALVDAKSSPQYKLSSTDYRMMQANYIPNYRELSDGADLELEFCLYVAGGFTATTDAALAELSRESHTPVSAITASEFLRLCQIKPAQELVRIGFRKGKVLNLENFVA